MTLSTLLHPLKLDVVGFQEDEHDYHFRVELPDRLRRADFNRDAAAGIRRPLVRNQPGIPNSLQNKLPCVTISGAALGSGPLTIFSTVRLLIGRNSWTRMPTAPRLLYPWASRAS